MSTTMVRTIMTLYLALTGMIAQELSITIKAKLRIAAVKMRVTIARERQPEVGRWMWKRQIDVACLQENT